MPSPTTTTTPVWLRPADQLLATLDSLDAQERRRALEYVNAPHEPHPPKPKGYIIGECVKAAERVAALQRAHPSWTQAKARRTVAREMNVSPVQLRYMLSKATEQAE